MSEDRTAVGRFVDALDRQDFASMAEVLHTDYVEELPQTGERIRGRDTWLRIVEGYPGGIPGLTDPAHVVGDGEQLIMTPSFSLIRATCDRGNAACYARCRYPDGSEWYSVWFMTVGDGRITRSVAFHAPILDPPGWRAELVERIEART
jgi:hypothetical protein